MLSLANGESTSMRTSNVALHGHVTIGSSGGWLMMVDERGALRMANLVTRVHADLLAIATVLFLHPVSDGGWFCLHFEPLP